MISRMRVVEGLGGISGYPSRDGSTTLLSTTTTVATRKLLLLFGNIANVLPVGEFFVDIESMYVDVVVSSAEATSCEYDFPHPLLHY